MMTHEAVVQGLQRAGFQSVSTAVAHALPAHKKGLECFPNPFAQQLVLQYITAKAIPVQVQVYDVLGRTVATYSGVLQQVGPPDQFALDATGWPSGPLVVHVHGESFQARCLVLHRTP